MLELDLKGLSCPEPVIKTKRALKENPQGVISIVDNRAALENISRFGSAMGYKVNAVEKDGAWRIEIKKIALDNTTMVVTYVATFENHYKAMLFKKGMGEGCVLKPVPRLLSSSCGTAAFFILSQQEKAWLENASQLVQLVESIYRLEGNEGDKMEDLLKSTENQTKDDPILHEGKQGVKLTSLVKTSGCAAKLPPGKLHHVIDSLPLMSNDRLLEGFESADDALVYSVDGDTVSVQTVDFFPPMVDDPYTFGQVAAANALSDIYAMGGEPNVAMNLVCFPSCLELDVLRNILLGGIDKVREAGAIIAGGHTIADPTPKYGLCVTGFMKKSQVWSNKGAQVGDYVVITKALGVGMINTAAKAGEVSANDFDVAIKSMTTLNKKARDLARDLDVHAATDITGFSLSGHLSECADAANLSIEVNLSSLPILPGALNSARFGLIPEGRYTNEDYLFSKVSFPAKTPTELKDIVFGPETSGGLALFMSKSHADIFVNRMNQDSTRIIGQVIPRTNVSVVYKSY